MGYEWFSRAYFPVALNWKAIDYQRVVSAVEQAGLIIPLESYEWTAYWRPFDRTESKTVPDRPTLFQWMEKDSAGYIGVASASPDVRANLVIDPRAEFGFPSQGDHADDAYGCLSLLVDPHTMLDESENLIADAVKLIWRCSLAMARSVETIYGLGDFFNRNNSSPVIYLDDIAHRRVPRLAWWNYFGPDYFKHWNEAEWPGAGVWAEHRDDHGWTVIMRPPEGPLHSSRAEDSSLFSA